MSEKDLVLVVEDDPLVSEVIVATLDDSYRTMVVETSGGALDILKQGNVQLMLLDCTLPGGISPDLLPEADRAGTPVIMMSGDPARMKALSETPRPFVRKPFTLAGLLGMVENVLQSSHADRSKQATL